MKPFSLTAESVIKQYKTDPLVGLSGEQVAERQLKYGRNVVPERPPESISMMFLRQFQNPLIYILLAAAVIIFFVGSNIYDAFIISGILLFNATIGTIQEGRTRYILASLKQFITAEALVIRDGKNVVLDAGDLVPGDIVLLQEGQRAPADIRLISATNLHVDEALLTGESVEVLKDAGITVDETVPLGDRRNMVFKGTYILAGLAKGIVVATGRNTEIGKIQQEAQEIQTDMPLKRELDRLSWWILIGVLALCVTLFVVGIFTGKPFRELLVTITALFICVVPEGLPVVLTLVLVSGVYRMAKQHVLVKRMQAVEALGRTDVIVTDKTGTLTRNEMMVSDIVTADASWQVTGEGYKSVGFLTYDEMPIQKIPEPLHIMGFAGVLLNNSQITLLPCESIYVVKGDPTEAALNLFAQKIGITREQADHSFKKLQEIPFDSQLKYHAGFYLHEGNIIALIVGAPETLFQWSNNDHHALKAGLNKMLDRGLRVIAIADKVFTPESFDSSRIDDIDYLVSTIQSGCTLLGLCGIQDAIRPEVATAIQETRAAGLHVIMATGDHKKTALYVAEKVGIFKPGDEIVDGADFEQLPDGELLARLHKITVYSRVSPAHKLRIIRLFHLRHDMVAMTGDGVNDVPSLIAADIGIAMGRIGTEVAKEAADIVLLDDSFVNIVSAIEQGRHIFYTLRRVILYFFATNAGEVLILIFAMAAYFVHPTFPLPLTAAQILWLNLITDGFLDVALSMEPQEEGLLTHPWFKATRHLVDRRLLFKTLYMAIPMAIGSLAVFAYYHDIDLAYARTMTLVTMAMFQWFNAWNCRSERLSLFKLGLWSNIWLIIATIFVFSLQLALVYVPFLQALFKTVPITFGDWIIVILISSSVLILEEARKLLMRNRENRLIQNSANRKF